MTISPQDREKARKLRNEVFLHLALVGHDGCWHPKENYLSCECGLNFASADEHDTHLDEIFIERIAVALAAAREESQDWKDAVWEASRDWQEEMNGWRSQTKHSCGCELDSRGDVCMAHYPAKVKLEKQIAAAREEQREALEQIVELCKYAFSALDIKKVALAALGQAEPKEQE